MNIKEEEEEKEHSPLGPSAAHRWMLCPGSVKLSEGMPNETSEYAEEGTRAHELAETILNNKPVPIDTDLLMHSYVEQYTNLVKGELNRCQTKQASAISLKVESKIYLNDIDNRLFGTVDAMFYCASEGRLYVFDLKYGKGVEVEVEDNPQLLYYALAGWSTCFAREVVLIIVQPRIMGDTTKRVIYTTSDMNEFADKLTIAVTKVDELPDKFVPGTKQCKWCLGSAICPEQSRAFSAVTKIDPIASEPELPNFLQWSPEQLSEVYQNKKRFIKWLEDVEAYIAHLNKEDNTHVPGTKMVRQRKNRVFINPKEAEETLRKKGWKVKDIIIKKLKTPNQLEQVGVAPEVISEITIIPQGKAVLALEDDKRPAIEMSSIAFDSVEEDDKNG